MDDGGSDVPTSMLVSNTDVFRDSTQGVNERVSLLVVTAVKGPTLEFHAVAFEQLPLNLAGA